MNNTVLTYAAGAVGAVCAATVFLHWQNTSLQTKRYVYSSPHLPKGFKGLRIAHISDYHNTKNMETRLFKAVSFESPDIIVITGDLFDSRKTDIGVGLSLAEKLAKIAPVYMVCGNHEARIEDIEKIKKAIGDAGVKIIENMKITLERNGDVITLAGVADPRFYRDGTNEGDKGRFRQNLLSFMADKNKFTILLSHRPEFIHTYRDADVDLAFTGHAHGGQFGIPFTDYGVFVPNQGIFPPYAAGMKTLDNTTVVISRGIGNSAFPFRLFNFPELVMVEFV